MRGTLIGFLVGIHAAIPALSAPTLFKPVDCVIGNTCFIQNYVDRDPTSGQTDIGCGALSYDGHKGTDFALPTLRSMEIGVDVLAAAGGVVTGTRIGMRDQIATPKNFKEIEGRECGNGVVIDHGDGWVTQYCHLKNGSVNVAKGQRLKAGDLIGQIGLSGKTQFPHLHMSLRQNDIVVDPFQPNPNANCGDTQAARWADPIPYVPGGLIDVAFAPAMPDFAAIKAGTASQTEMPNNAKALVLFAYGYGSRPGDQISFTIKGPNGDLMDYSVSLEERQAQYFRAAGKRIPNAGWKSGQYSGVATLTRGDVVLSQKIANLTIR